MNSLVIIFLPAETTFADFEDALSKHVKVFDRVEADAVVHSDNAEHLPLWRWFAF